MCVGWEPLKRTFETADIFLEELQLKFSWAMLDSYWYICMMHPFMKHCHIPLFPYVCVWHACAQSHRVPNLICTKTWTLIRYRFMQRLCTLCMSNEDLQTYHVWYTLAWLICYAHALITICLIVMKWWIYWFLFVSITICTLTLGELEKKFQCRRNDKDLIKSQDYKYHGKELHIF